VVKNVQFLEDVLDGCTLVEIEAGIKQYFSSRNWIDETIRC